MKRTSRESRGTLTALAIASQTLTVCAIASAAAVELVSHVVFSRCNKPSDVLLLYDESMASAYPREAFYFESESTILRGFHYPRTNSKGTVVLVPGIDSCADSHLAEAAYFLNAGWSVLSFDATGICGSGGTGKVGLIQAKIDLEALLSYANSNGITSDRPVCLYGHSVGGYAVASALADGIDVTAVCCIAAFDSPCEVSVYEISTLVGPLASFISPFIWLHQRRLYGGTADITAIDGINACQDVPVLVVYGTQDEVVPAYDVGIVAHRDKLSGFNATFLEISEPYRNHHTTAWLSEHAARLTESLAPSTSGRKLSIADRMAMSEVDDGFMSEVETFFSKAACQQSASS